MGWFNPLLGRFFLGNAVSPRPAGPLSWVFCLHPREPVGPAGLCAHGLGRSCSETVLLGVVARQQPGHWLGCVADLRFGLELSEDPLLGSVLGGSQALILLCTHPGAFCLCAQAASLLIRAVSTWGFRCGPWATDCGMRPLGHFGFGTQAAGPLIGARAHPEFKLWAPSLLIWVRATGLQVSAGAAYPVFTVQGLSGEGPQRWLLWRVL